MRFVELGPHPGGPRVRLHPRITVLRGLDPVARVGIVGMVHDLALGELPDLDAVVEIDGVEFPVGEAVEFVGATADSGLIIPADSLPAPSTGDTPDAAVVEREIEAATAEVETLTEMITGLAEEIGSGEAVRTDMKASLTSATARLDDEAATLLDRADARLVRAARAKDRPDPWTGMGDVEERMEHLQEVLAELDEQQQALPEGDRGALAAAVATARCLRDTDETPCPEAASLAQEWSALHVRLAMLESRLEAEDCGPDEPAARLEEAQAGLKTAEAATIPRRVTDDEAKHLEELHDVMLEAEGRASKGIRKGSGRAEYEAAMSTLQDALEPLGYPTWAAFRMGNGKVNVSDEALASFERSKEELARAEEVWSEVAARLEEDTELQEVLGRIDTVLARASELIGSNPLSGTDDPSAVIDALREVEIDPAELEMSEADAVEDLRAVLRDAGGPGHWELRSEAGLVLLGASWVEVLAAADEARARIERDRERARAELVALEALEGSRVDRLDDERTEVREAEKAVAATREAMCGIVRARLQLHVLAVTELSLAQQHDDTVTELEAAEEQLERIIRLGRGSDDVGVEELAARVPRGQGGPVPIVVVMGEAPAEHLEAVRSLPDDVQVLVIGDGYGLDEWVDRVGPEEAMSVEASTFV